MSQADPELGIIRRPSEQGLEEDYIDNRLSRTNSEIGSQIQYDIDRVKYNKDATQKPNESFIWVDLQIDKNSLKESSESFTQALEKFKEEKKSEKKVVVFNLDNANNWEDVIKVVDNAQTGYFREEKISEKIRAKFRKLADHGKAIEPWVKLLPDGEYKTLCGGLQLILGIMIRHSEIREKMADLVEELPNYIKECNGYQELYPEWKRWNELSIKLYIHLFQALEVVVRWYMRPKADLIKRASKRLFEGPLYAQILDNHIKDIQKSAMEIRLAATQNLHRRMAWMNITTLTTNVTVNEVKEDTTRILQVAQRVEKSVDTGIVSFKELLREQIAKSEWQSSRIAFLEAKLNAQKAQLRDKCFTTDMIAQRLGLSLPYRAHAEDIQHVLRSGNAKTSQFQDRSRWLAESPQCRTWLSSKDSGVLFVDGKSSKEPISPLSFYVALLSESLQERDDVLVLSFFCGLHKSTAADIKERVPTVLHMLQGLLSQILSLTQIQSDVEPEFLPLSFVTDQHIADLSNGSLDEYIAVISKLVTILRPEFSAIFILIDGIDYYDGTWPVEMKKVVNGLSELVGVTDEEVETVVKVVFTTSTRSLQPTSNIGNSVKMKMPPEVGSRGRPFNSRVAKRGGLTVEGIPERSVSR